MPTRSLLGRSNPIQASVPPVVLDSRQAVGRSHQSAVLESGLSLRLERFENGTHLLDHFAAVESAHANAIHRSTVAFGCSQLVCWVACQAPPCPCDGHAACKMDPLLCGSHRRSPAFMLPKHGMTVDVLQKQVPGLFAAFARDLPFV